MAQLRQGSNISVLYREGLNGVWNTNYPSGQHMGDNASQVRIQLDPVVTTLTPTQSLTTTPTITATEEIDISHYKVEIYQDCPNAAGCGSQCTYVPNWDRSRTCAWNKCNHDYTASDPDS